MALSRQNIAREPDGNGWVLSAADAPVALWRRAIVEICQELTSNDMRSSARTLSKLGQLLNTNGRGSLDLAGIRLEVRADLKPQRVSLHLTID